MNCKNKIEKLTGVYPITVRAEIFWYLENETEDVPYSVLISEIEQSFEHWQDFMFPVLFLRTEIREYAKIIISFDKDSKKCAFNQIAVAYPPREKEAVGFIYLNDKFDFTDKVHLRKKNIEKVLTHEIGHVLGLGHSCDENCIMFSSYRNKKDVYLSFETIDCLSSIYGSEIIKYLNASEDIE